MSNSSTPFNTNMVAEGSCIEFKYQDKLTVKIITDPTNQSKPINILVTKHDACKQFVKVEITKEGRAKADKSTSTDCSAQGPSGDRKRIVNAKPTYGNSSPNCHCSQRNVNWNKDNFIVCEICNATHLIVCPESDIDSIEELRDTRLAGGPILCSSCVFIKYPGLKKSMETIRSWSTATHKSTW